MEKISSEPKTNQARSLVDELYSYRDLFFQNHDISEAHQREDYLKLKLKETIEKLTLLQDSIQPKSEWLYLMGKAYNVTSEYCSDAERFLCKAVKLEPGHALAWTHLGEVYWKKEDILNAQNCFVGALKNGKNKEALRNLSIILRVVVSNLRGDERTKMIEESVEKAKEAVGLDPSDGKSWTILGNAYLSLYFECGQKPANLQLCFNAYLQAEKDVVAATSSDLHFNRGMALMYQDDYEQCLDCLERAHMFDPSWAAPKMQQIALLNFLCKTQQHIDTKGKLRAKRVKTYRSSLVDSQLGPYAGGTYRTAAGKTLPMKMAQLGELSPGQNDECVVLGKIISCTGTFNASFSFCMIDKSGDCCCVCVSNLASEYGVKIGDSIAIPEPFVTDHNFQFKDKKFNLRSIRVVIPIIMVVNGHRMPKESAVPTQLHLSAIHD